MDRKGETKPILIAMKGHPGTGKSTLANAITKALKYPLIDKDHFRDCTYTIEQALMKACPSTATKLLNDLSYEAMWRVISTQLELGLSVVVDSPLSRRAHLDRLLEMASQSGARVVIIECRPGDEAEWRRRLEERGAAGGSGWHKP
ncbi:2',3'-cyclic-nucleotide 3'-phosphodiesterase [Handroanthus impetiginosus]|uniref:2',3'-cyclic-nucleotide 3'-phosphodiesterase n=1 Tax=Handroanthus impetiginosus TaxID=429701 RepID=A0A2G9GV30_9LAMI|nr:2',3'-cyclic-nucleotide 3'-phosphodiesterase [Handroanthus impetiginosus]